MFQNFLTRPINTLLPYYVNVIHSGGVLDYAIVMGFLQGSMVIGALITTLKKRWSHQMHSYFIGLLIMNVGYLMFAFVPIGQILIIGLSAAVFAFCTPILNSIYMTMVQSVVPKDKIGRIISIDYALSMAISPIGSIASGFLTEIFGLYNLILFCAIISIILTLFVWNNFVKNKIDYQNEQFLLQTKQVLGEPFLEE